MGLMYKKSALYFNIQKLYVGIEKGQSKSVEVSHGKNQVFKVPLLLAFALGLATGLLTGFLFLQDLFSGNEMNKVYNR